MKSALIVVDFQNDFISGALGFQKAKELRAPIRDRILKALSMGEDLFFTLDTHDKDSYFEKTEGKNLPVMHCERQSFGWELDDSVLEFKSKAKVFEKNTFGSFELAQYLRAQNYERIELCGLVCSICVFSNAVLLKAACSEAEIVIDSGLTEDSDAKMKEKALELLENVHIKVIRRNK